MIEKEKSESNMSARRRYLISLSFQLFLGILFVSGMFMLNRNEPVKITRHVESSKTQVLKGPGAATLLKLSGKLNLTDEQVNGLTSLNNDLESNLDSIDSRIKESMEEFKQKVQSKNADSKKLSLADVTRLATPATELGRKRRSLVRDYDERAMKLLTEEQRQKALELFDTMLKRG